MSKVLGENEMKFSKKTPWHGIGTKVFVVFGCGHGDYLIQTLTVSSYSTVYYFEEHAVPRSPKSATAGKLMKV